MKMLAIAAVAALCFSGCDKASVTGKVCYTDPVTGNQVCVAPMPPPPPMPAPALEK